MHQRRKIINAVQGILLGSVPSGPPTLPISEVGDRIFVNRPTPLWLPELPCICLYAMSETAQTDEEPKFYRRRLRLMVEIIVAPTPDSDVLVDTIVEKVENLLLHERFLREPTTAPIPGTIPEQDPANTSDNITMADTEIVFVGERVENMVTSCRVAFEIEYTTTPNYGVAEDIFDEMQVTYKVPGKDANTPPAIDHPTEINQE